MDDKAPVSLYYQLKEKMKKKIKSGEWPVESRIPTERALCSAYGVSRITVRQALDDLKREGHIYSKQGKGTFVRRLKIEQGLEKFYSFSEDIKRMGYDADSKILEFKTIDCDDLLIEILKLKNKDKVYKIKRLRYADSEPFDVETSYIPVKDHPDMFEKDIAKLVLYNVLKEKYDEFVNKADETFEAAIIDHKYADLLSVEKNSAVILLKRIAKANEKPVEYCETVIRGDRSKYKIVLK